MATCSRIKIITPEGSELAMADNKSPFTWGTPIAVNPEGTDFKMLIGLVVFPMLIKKEIKVPKITRIPFRMILKKNRWKEYFGYRLDNNWQMYLTPYNHNKLTRPNATSSFVSGKYLKK